MSRFGIPVIGLLVLASCATPEPRAAPEAPTLSGDQPAIGRRFSLELTEAGRPLVLEGVKGRVTLVCVLHEEPEIIIDTCRQAQERWLDRVAVVGLATNGQLLDPATVPFRFYLDPQGEALGSALNLSPHSQVIVVDVRGRVADALPIGRLAELEPMLSRMVP